MRKRTVLMALVAVVIAATAWVFYRPGQAEAGPQLTLAQVSRGDVVDTVQATGNLEAVTTVQVGSQVSGAIKALHADFNSVVRRGQVIAELEPSLFETQVEQARATLVRLQAELDRTKLQVDDSQVKLRRARELSERQLIPAAELETVESNARQAQSAVKAAEAQIVQARASLNQNQVNLGHTVIRSPIDGIVISRNVDVGQTVAASMQAPVLFVIAQDLTQMQVNASIDESDIGRIAAGQHVTFRVDAHPDTAFTGTVSQVRLQPIVTQNVVSYVTIIDVPNSEQKLKPGMTATVTVEIARANDVLRVPNGALRFRPTAEIFAALGQPMPEQAAPRPAGARGTAGEGQPAIAGQAPGEAASPAQRERMIERMKQMSPEEQERMREGMSQRRGMPPGMREKMQQMSPEERRKMREQMRQAAPAEGQQAAQAQSPGAPQGTGPGGRRRGAAAARSAGGEGDAPTSAPPRPLWIFVNGKLERLMVRTGISDSTMTAILDDSVKEGTQVATGITQPPAASSGAVGFFPFGGGRGGFGGPGFVGPGGGRPGGGAGLGQRFERRRV